MQKKRKFKDVIFDIYSLEKGIDEFKRVSNFEDKYDFQNLLISFTDEEWVHDSFDEFYADYRKEFKHVLIILKYDAYELRIEVNKYFADTTISVLAKNRNEIEKILNCFENSSYKFKIEKEDSKTENNPVIFIGHGGNPQWRDLKDHLSDKHGFEVVAYETGARAGHTIRDILEEMSDMCSFACLVLTGEDEGKEGSLNARPNVIHETGLFQGKLGFSRAIVLLEEDTAEFSNLYGIQQIRFSKGNIKETFGDVIATIKREYGENYN